MMVAVPVDPAVTAHVETGFCRALRIQLHQLEAAAGAVRHK